MAKRCSKGQTLRRGFTRRSHRRSPYLSRSGSLIKGKRIKSSYVPPTCIKRRGASVKSGIIIPDRRDYEGLLRSYGYSLDLPSSERKEAIRRAITNVDPLLVLRRLVNFRTYRKYERFKESREAKNYDELDSDIKWLQNIYQKYNIKERRKSRLGSRNANQTIGKTRIKRQLSRNKGKIKRMNRSRRMRRSRNMSRSGSYKSRLNKRSRNTTKRTREMKRFNPKWN